MPDRWDPCPGKVKASTHRLLSPHVERPEDDSGGKCATVEDRIGGSSVDRLAMHRLLGSVYPRHMDAASEEPERPPQGWFVDPFGVHDARWFSQGSATALVRDGRAESQDPPPDVPVSGPLLPVRTGPTASGPGDDLLRAGDDGNADAWSPSEQDRRRDGTTAGGLGATGFVMGGHLDGTEPATGRARSRFRSRFRSHPPVPTTPRRQLRARWIALGGAVVWSILLAGQLFAANTVVGTDVRTGQPATESFGAANPGAITSVIVLLVLACGITGVGFVRRVRSRSESWSRSGGACAAVIGLLGVASLATVGLSLIVLAALLFVVARPIRRPRPIPGERVVLPE